MRYDSVNRLRHLGAIREAKNAASRAATDNAMELRQRLQRAEGRRRQIEADFHPRDAVDALKKIDADLDSLREELGHAEDRRAEAGAAFQAAARVHDNAVAFATENGLDLPDAEKREASGIQWPQSPEGAA